MAIQSFGEANTGKFFKEGIVRKGVGWSNLQRVVRRKLDMVHYAAKLEDLKSPPNNRLEALTRNLQGYHSIRINDQWRVVFKWTENGPDEVRVTDYH